MVIRTFATTINDATYTKVGDNVANFSISENYVGSIKVVVTDTGDPAPAISEANHIPIDKGYERYSDAADIWMATPSGTTTVYGEVS